MALASRAGLTIKNNMFIPKYHLKVKLPGNAIGLIPVGDPPFVKEETNPAGLEAYKTLKEQYPSKEFAGPEERTKIQEEAAAEERSRKW